jgi:hypothetical protein
MIKDEIIVNYSGILTFETMGSLLAQLEEGIKKHNIKVGVYKKLLSMMIETLENIYRYNDSFDKIATLDELHFPRFCMLYNGNEFVISSGNPILNKDVETLNERLKNVNSLKSDELRDLYKKTITNGRFSMKGGAGLGFIEMAKASSQKLKFKFEEVNEEYSYFSLEIIVPN